MDKRDIFESLIKEALADGDFDDLVQSDCFPQHIISGSGWGWFLDPQSMQMIRTQRGAEIIPIADDPDTYNRMLVQTPSRILLIPESEIIEIGWN